MVFAEPRFATAIIEERDLAGLADANEELDRVVTRLLERRPEIKLAVPRRLMPVSEVIKLDLSRAAARLSETQPGVKILNYSGSGIETTFTQGEDACLAALVPACPVAPTDQRRLLIVGALPDIVEDQFRRLFAEIGIDRVDSLPPRRAKDLPEIGPGTVFLLAQPFLGDTAQALEDRGCKHLPALFPFGAEGTTAWLHAAGAGLRHRRDALSRVRSPRAAPVPSARWNVTPSASNGKTIFFMPDSQLEVPLARFLANELGMKPVEVGTPYLHRAPYGRRTGGAARGRADQRGPGRRQASSTACAPPSPI